MFKIPESELILDKRGAIYHLGVRPEELAKIIIVVGDPDRVKKVTQHFDRVETTCRHREFITHTGYLGNKRISVISTGIGPDNIDIALNEIDALANIDFENRVIKTDFVPLHILRLGTSGSLQADIPVDELVAGTHGLGFDNVMHYYAIENNESEKKMIADFKAHTGLQNGNVTPYIFSGSTSLLSLFGNAYHQGITVACPGFYGPQGRILRLPLAYPGLIEKLTNFKTGNHRISNFEMESSAIYGLGRALGHECLSLNVVVANRVTQQFSKDGDAAVEKLIKTSLEKIADSNL
ncbi:MAG: phosphorylase [Niastella sp. SCN 39-18]|nr:nucleoside phosphorylase [Sphingobacteriales bacterium]ODT49755.1 MAG: phosphorylase [Niastella sp. SCN 39-18]OJW07527.1 MAG: phosphorylase [Sphingobacteriales bacterium 39-19]